jgi:hypothetical protein
MNFRTTCRFVSRHYAAGVREPKIVINSNRWPSIQEKLPGRMEERKRYNWLVSLQDGGAAKDVSPGFVVLIGREDCCGCLRAIVGKTPLLLSVQREKKTYQQCEGQHRFHIAPQFFVLNEISCRQVRAPSWTLSRHRDT